ncbi:hypothetical protein FRC19_007070 [Serendipita sp. 401]|nr:hypothetical protein FRC19_007070 [Serendipita sp. 401]KAG9054061.1 hypothetical protein FS842_006312 [Serendipita sp. 407]
MSQLCLIGILPTRLSLSIHSHSNPMISHPLLSRNDHFDSEEAHDHQVPLPTNQLEPDQLEPTRLQRHTPFPFDATEVIMTLDVYQQRLSDEMRLAGESISRSRLRPLYNSAPNQNVHTRDVQTSRDFEDLRRAADHHYSSPLPPLPAHLATSYGDFLLFLFRSQPGTTYLDGIPNEIRQHRNRIGACRFCGSFHLKSEQACHQQKYAVRSSLHPHYQSVVLEGKILFVPQQEAGQASAVQYTHEKSYPGAVFLFTALPEPIRVARTRLQTCIECGIKHDPNAINGCNYLATQLIDEVHDEIKEFNRYHRQRSAETPQDNS